MFVFTREVIFSCLTQSSSLLSDSPLATITNSVRFSCQFSRRFANRDAADVSVSFGARSSTANATLDGSALILQTRRAGKSDRRARRSVSRPEIAAGEHSWAQLRASESVREWETQRATHTMGIRRTVGR